MNKTKQHTDGFSLIELLIVVAVIGIIAAIAVPSILASRRAANEGSAVASLRTLRSAQATYQSTAGDGAYADTLAALQNEQLIDLTLGGADPSTKSGYQFAIVEQGGNGATAVFGAYGFPTTTAGPGKTGSRRFGITHNGILYADTDLSATPNTLALITGMPVFGE